MNNGQSFFNTNYTNIIYMRKKVYAQNPMYSKFVDSNNNYLKSHINDDLWLNDIINLFYIVNAWLLNSIYVIIIIWIQNTKHIQVSYVADDNVNSKYMTTNR